MNFKDVLNKVLGNKPAPNKVDYTNFINKQQQYRYTQDIKDYKQALQAAESVLAPNRQLLYNLYNNISLDAHLSSQLDSRKVKVLSQKFKVSRNGVDDADATALFVNQKWFQDWLELAWESVPYGYSLIYLDGIVAGKIGGVELVPRQHVKPASTLVVANPSDMSGRDYSSAPYSDWYTGIGKPNDLGVLAKVAPLVLFKQNALANWVQFCELFGMPLRIGRTNSGDPNRVQAMDAALREMSSAAYAVLDKDDAVELVAVANSDGSVYDNVERWLDEQISKVVLGGTMNSDNGGSRAQGEVHERLANTYAEYDLKNLTYAVNDVLFPVLIKQGFDLTNCTFSFYQEEDKVELFDMSIKLIQSGYTVDEEWITNTFNIPVVKQAPQPAPTTGNFQKPE